MTTVLAFLFYSFVLLLSELTRESIELHQGKCEELPWQVCPGCGSEHLIKNGSVYHGKSKYQCKSCERQFVVNPTKIIIPKKIKRFIDRLLLERISLQGIARVTRVSWSWLQDYVSQKLARTSRQIKVSGKLPGKLTIECDDLGSFVNRKKNEVYIWLAIDRNSRKKIGYYIGDRTRKSARKLWASLPEVYQQCACFYTDFWQAYKTIIPRERHRAVGKETGLTNHIERLNNTFKQRVSRAGKRKPIIFQKAEQSPWSNLVLHSWLQYRAGKDLSLTTTFILLPSVARWLSGFDLASTSIASLWRRSGGKLAATERLGLMLGDQWGVRRTGIYANLIAPKVLPVIEPGLQMRSTLPMVMAAIIRSLWLITLPTIRSQWWWTDRVEVLICCL